VGVATYKVREEVERRYTSEVVLKFYAKERVVIGCPLGPIPPEYEKLYGRRKAIRIYRPWRPEVDFVVKKPDLLVLAEVKFWKPFDGPKSLLLYKTLVKETPELEMWWEKPVRLELYVPEATEALKVTCRVNEISLIEWAPEWIMEKWRKRELYWSKEAILKRAYRKTVLRELGFE